MPEGMPSLTLGGAYSGGGPPIGVYHTKVVDAQPTISDTKRMGVKVKFEVFEDPQHPAKNGKPLSTETWWLPKPPPEGQEAGPDDDDEDKVKLMRGMFKRALFDGFKIDWPKDPNAPLEPRKWVNRKCYVLVDETQDKRDGSVRNRIVAITQDPKDLPKPKKQRAAGGGSGESADGEGGGQEQEQPKTRGRRR